MLASMRLRAFVQMVTTSQSLVWRGGEGDTSYFRVTIAKCSSMKNGLRSWFLDSWKVFANSPSRLTFQCTLRNTTLSMKLE